MLEREREAQIKVLNQYFHKLVVATQSCVSEIADKCLSHHLITSSTQNEILNTVGLSPETKTRKLLVAVRESMEHQNECLKTFLEILDGLMIFSDLTKEIRLALEKSRQNCVGSTDKNGQHTVKEMKLVINSETSPRAIICFPHPLLIIATIVVIVAVVVAVININPHINGSEHKAQDKLPLTGDDKQTYPSIPGDEQLQVQDDEMLVNIPYQSGERVVDLCIKKLYSSTFNMLSDNKLMRRIAYVMSDFGRNVQGNGGIWQLPYTAFEDTMDTRAHKRLPRKYSQIWDSFEIDWKSVKYKDLDKPFYSALAARLYLSNFADHIPPANQIEKQAEYWKFYYMAGEGDTAHFVEKVHELEKFQLQSANY